MDIGLCQGMRHLPTEQESDTPIENTSIQNSVRPRGKTILTHCHGPYHWTTQQQGLQCHPHDHQSWMFPRCNIFTMHNNHHWTPNHQTLSQPFVPMVRFTQTSH